MSLSADRRRWLLIGSPPDDRVLRVAQGLGWLALAAALARAGWLTLADLPIPGVDPPSERTQDFRDATYYPIRELFRSGGMPYDPQAMFGHWPVVQEFDLYLPAHLWLHAPLAWPGYRAGAIAMFGLNATLLIALAWCAVRWAPVPARWQRPCWQQVAWPWLAGALVAGQVGKAQLYLGQINPLVALGTAGTLACRDRPRLAAVFLALAWLKPQFGLVLTVLLLASGRRWTAQWWTAIGGTALAAAASLPVLGVLVVREGGLGGFVEVIRANLAYATSTGYGAVDSPTGLRIDLTATASRAFGWTPPGGAEVVTAVVVLAIAVFLIRHARRGDRSHVSSGQGAARAGLADLVAVLALLLAVVHQPGDTLAAVPAAVAAGIGASRLPRAARALVFGALAALAVPFCHLFAIDQALMPLIGQRGVGLIDAVAVLVAGVLAVAALALAPAGRR